MIVLLKEMQTEKSSLEKLLKKSMHKKRLLKRKNNNKSVRR